MTPVRIELTSKEPESFILSIKLWSLIANVCNKFKEKSRKKDNFLLTCIDQRITKNFNYKMKPRILITNDDGYNAPGIRALVESVLHIASEIIVVAPLLPNSGMSNAITVKNPVRIFENFELKDLSNEHDVDVKVYVCDGTPVDSMKLAFNQIMRNNIPDLVLSGINHGANSGISILYSGTMGATIEGCLRGVPSVGFSILNHSNDADFTHSKPIVKQICQLVIDKGLPLGTCLNVNIPHGKNLKGIRLARQTKGVWVDEYEVSKDGSQKPVYWITGSFDNHEPNAEGTDEYLLTENYVTVVPVKVDMTDYQTLEKMKSWSIFK